MHVLIVAAACSPRRGSEPGVGWNWLFALSKRHTICAIVGEHDGARLEIEREFREHPRLRDQLRIVSLPFPNPPQEQRLPAPLNFAVYYRQYRQWHRRAFQLARTLARQERFDVVHQLNIIGYREPGYLWKLGVPFVWGPVGGVLNLPLEYLPSLGTRGMLLQLVRAAVNEWQLRFSPRVRRAMAAARVIVTATPDTGTKLRRVLGYESVWIPETMTLGDPSTTRPRQRQEGAPLRLLWSGLHIERKALPILLDALALLPPSCNWELDILGEGPLTAKWRAQSERLGLASRCRWHGWLPHGRGQAILADSDVFCFPSLLEATSSVVFEALSLGVPVVCFDHCGMGAIVDDTCGITVPLRPARAAAERFSAAIARLAASPLELSRRQAGAVARALEHQMDARVEAMTKVYERAASGDWHGMARRMPSEPVARPMEQRGLDKRTA